MGQATARSKAVGAVACRGKVLPSRGPTEKDKTLPAKMSEGVPPRRKVGDALTKMAASCRRGRWAKTKP
ncbi:hypothetical protein NDU88_010309 [Pleurodeles waltl]|uniref:Uncharacterized protein n=1 Tax=Pleurodeles waltl TaxID=8319 RepID=A0AAV7RXW4_PLEWA|nr:hypothetical protein NDU88_010309 [Pleurodeles waltl]